jgi:hypothetical protein
MSFTLLFAIFTFLKLMEVNIQVTYSSSTILVSGLVFLVVIRLLRRSEERLRRSFYLTFPVAIIVVATELYLCGGDAGGWAVPLAALMYTCSFSAIWFFDPKAERGNFIRYFFKRIPLAIVISVMGGFPSYAIAVPARLLRHNPNLYLAWCGICFPFFSVLLRVTTLSFLSRYLEKVVNEGKMSANKMSSTMATFSFAMTTSLNFGNYLLMYMSSTASYATAGAVFSIGVELGTKFTVIEFGQWALRNLAKEAVKERLLGIKGGCCWLEDAAFVEKGGKGHGESCSDSWTENRRGDESYDQE